jgi:hypothetical protein
MEYNKLRYLELLKQYTGNEIKWLGNENKKYFEELFEYKIMVENHFFWEKRYKFISAMEDYINGKTNGDDFGSHIWNIRSQAMYLKDEFEKDFEKFEDFEPNPKSKNFYEFIDPILMATEFFEPDAEEHEKYGELWLKDCTKMTLLGIQEYL